MFAFAGEAEPLVNLIFLLATGYIAWTGITFRTEEG